MVTEFAAALAAKLRAGTLDARDADAAARAFDALAAGSFTRVIVTVADSAGAAAFAARRDVALRAGEALHLAVAGAVDATLYTLDVGLARAADVLGVPAVLVSAGTP